MEDFSKQKIVWGNLNLNASYSFAPCDMFINAPCSMIVTSSSFILAVLNSKVADYYIRNLGVTRNGGYFEYKPMFIEQLPIPIITKDNEIEFDSIVNTIYIKKQNRIDTSNEEKIINDIIYKLYNLELQEIQLIESQ